MIAVLLALILSLAPQSPTPQAPAREARAVVTVVDQTGAVIPNATVTITSPDNPTAKIEPVKTNEKGVATIGGLAAGRYVIQAEFPGFETHQLKDIRLKAGDNKHVVVLQIQGLQDSVTVARDKQEIASDRKATFGTALTREQIDALSDDPDEMAQQLQDMAGGNAVIRVDSFEGGRLPPKSTIKAVHITRDAFAAENHYAGGIFIDIVTQPGLGPLRTNMNFRLRDGSFSGKPPATISTAPKGPEQIDGYNGGFGGSLIKQKASFNISVNGQHQYDTPYFNYTGPDGVTVTSLAPRRPRNNMFLVGLFDYALTKDQTLRVQYFDERFDQHNLGIGGFDMLERGYSSSDRNHTLRLQEVGPLGRRFFMNTRASMNWYTSDSHSVFEAPTIIVLDTFDAGGRQQTGGTRSKSITLQSDLDYVRGINSVRTGIQLDGGSFHSDASSNYLGTYTFEDMTSYLAGRPRSFTVRTGNPLIDYWNLQAALYVQDDIRVRKNLTLSPGVRYELQTHLSDYNNFGPRFGVTWAPGKGGRTSLRASAGVFYDWLQSSVYEQTLRVDGVRQRELDVFDPTYPVTDAATLGTTAPTDKYLLGPGLQMARNSRVSAGIDQALTRMIRVNATYAHVEGSHLLRGDNLNAPVDGLRPDPRFVNVIEVVDDARQRQDTLNIGAVINFNVPPANAKPGGAPAGGPVMLNGGAGVMMIMTGGGPSAAGPNNPRWNWRRMSLFTNFGLGRSYNDTDGAFSPPTTGDLADDWGPANFDIRRRFNVNWSSQQFRNTNVMIGFNAASAAPYTIKSGIDSNGDLIFNDRPAGVGRNSARGSAARNMNGFFTYFWTFGRKITGPAGIAFRNDGGALAVSQGQANTAGRYRISLNVNAQNILNHANYSGYVGTLTSPLFGLPQSVSGMRKVDVGIGFSF